MCRFTAPVYRLQIIFARKQIQVPNLGLAGHEQLDGPCQEHFAVVGPQRAVIGGVYLVVDVLLPMQVFDESTPGDDQVNQRLDAFLGTRPFRSSMGMPSWQPNMFTVRMPFSTCSRPQRASRLPSPPSRASMISPGRKKS